MQTLQLDSLASQIVAWHNRHPLALRIGVQHVQSLGYVVLPFAATTSATAEPSAAVNMPAEPASLADAPEPDGATLRERAMARAAQASAETPDSLAPRTPRATAIASPLRPAFTEDFIRPLRPPAVAAFALQHGADEAAPGKHQPVRLVKPDARVALPLLQRRWLLTAQIDVDGRRSRLLAGVGPTPALLGKRIWSLPRMGLAVGLPLLTVAVLAMGMKALLEPAAVESALLAVAAVTRTGQAASAGAAAPGTTEKTVASAAAANTLAIADATPKTPAAPASAAAALPATAERPVDVDPTWGRVNLPSIGPAADERRRAAVAARQAAPETVAAPSRPMGLATLASAPPGAGQKTGPAPMAGPAFALSSRLIRTKAESEQIADAMRGLLATGKHQQLLVEALRSGDDWRVVCWPFSSREQADKARDLLASRGMKLQVVDF